MIRQSGGEYFNPDEVARQLREANGTLTEVEANSRAWHEGKRLLEQAIAERKSFIFESTLGGNTIAQLLEQALSAGLEVKIWYVGLPSPEQHIERVRARVAKGGHDIPEADIRRRYTGSLTNLARLLPKLTELKIFDNSEEGDPDAGTSPEPQLLLHWKRGRIEAPDLPELSRTPDWAKSIVAVAMKAHPAA